MPRCFLSSSRGWLFGRRPLRAWCRALLVPSLLVLATLALLGGAIRQATAQLSQVAGTDARPSLDPKQPVTFIADSVEYDRERGLVTATGHVEAWQNDHILRADRITFDRNTNVAAARGNVVLLEPDGQVIFADYAELSQGMKDGVLSGMRALLAENGRLAANGMRRTNGKLNELSRVVYSTCDLCEKDPTRPPLWQLRALSAVQDTENKRIEYHDSVLEMWGVPVSYFPYLSHPDPSVKRSSGLLIPSLGSSKHIGAFAAQPYYWVINEQSDMTVTPMMTSKAGPQLGLEYRHRFNAGEISLDSSINQYHGRTEGTIFARGQFNLDPSWRIGFDLNRASSANYIRDFNLGRFAENGVSVLPSQVFLEGFGQGAYFMLNSKLYQSISTSVTNSRLPLVFPRVQYSYFGSVDPLGGRFSLDTNAFNISRTDGTKTRRSAFSMNWNRPLTGPVGDLWKLTLNTTGALWDANDLHQQPNFLGRDKISTGRVHPQLALEVRWPFIRDAGAWGSQVIEPIAQVITAPKIGFGRFFNVPNEDSLDLEFSDTNLFALNRFPGIDRMEGGTRANVGLHAAWFLGGTSFDGLIGQSYRTETDSVFPTGSGLNGKVSDIVARATVAPTKWMDVTYRNRMDKDSFNIRTADTTASLGTNALRMSAGYTYSTYNPYQLYAYPPPPGPASGYYTPRNEISLGMSSSFDNYRLAGLARRDLASGQMVSIGAMGGYEDECYIFDIRFQRRYTSVNNDKGAATILFQMTLKSVGQVGVRAM